MPNEHKQLPLRHGESAAAFILIIQLLGGGAALTVAYFSRSLAAWAEGWHLLAGILVWLPCYMHQRLRRLAREEELETEALRQAAQDKTRLFEVQEAELFSAKNRVEQFEKYFLPVFSLLVCVVLGTLSFYLLRETIATPVPDKVESASMTAVIFGFASIISFLLARYSAGLAVEPAWRAVRPGANYSMSCAVGSFLVLLSLASYHFGATWLDPIVAYVIPILLGILGLETLIFLVWSIYRPRVPGVEWRAAHDSRLLGILTTSGGILRATADTLDYQFGFKVSETWFYRFMERALAPLILFQAVTLYLLTCMVVVNTGEQAVIERFGVPQDVRDADGNLTALGPGLHFKLPWPIDIARRYPVDTIQTLTIGEILHEDVPGYTWIVSHAKEDFSILVANRPTADGAEPAAPAPAPDEADSAEPAHAAPAVSLLTGTVVIHYSVKNIRDYLYNHKSPEEALKAMANRALIHYGAHQDFLEFLGYRRDEAMDVLKTVIETDARDQRLGIRIHTVMLQGLHPPAEVGEDFQKVNGAMQKRATLIWEAKGYRDSRKPFALGEAVLTKARAQAYTTRLAAVSQARETRFEKQLAAYRKAPAVFLHRKRLDAIVEALADRRKIIVPTWAHTDKVLNLDLKTLMSSDIMGTIEQISATDEESN